MNKIEHYTTEFETHFTEQMEYQNPIPNVAICIMGQLRSFFDEKIHNSIFELIENFNERYGEVVCFFLVNNEISFKGSEWKSDDELNRLKETFGDETKLKFESIIEKKINCNYITRFYTDEFFDDVIIPTGYTTRSYAYQRELMRECAVMISDYEKKTNIKFDSVVKMRPDKQVYVNKIKFKLYKHQTTILTSYYDFFRAYPRGVFNFLVKNLESFSLWVHENQILQLKTNRGEIVDMSEFHHEYQDLYMVRTACSDLKENITINLIKKIILG